MADDARNRVAAARAMIGTPFRLQGRDRDGIDCVGLVAMVHGLTDVAPGVYPLRGTSADEIVAELDRHFRRRKESVPAAGDVLLLRPARLQHHLGIWTGAGLVHAHAGLRRVVETPAMPIDMLLGIWFWKDG